jgi:ribosomal protein L16 Arg81 hydroxylase
VDLAENHMSLDCSFTKIIAPIAPDVFFQRFYEQEPLLIQRDDPLHYRDILSIKRVENWLSTATIRYPDVLMVQHEVDVATSEYADSDLRIDPERLFRRFAAGATIVIHNLERHMPELAALCRASEVVFSMPFQTNIYLSPPHAQGFRTHYDTHDVFVLQAEGSKHWNLYDTKLALPLPVQKFDKDRDIPGNVSQAFTLNSGDFLYCPRGLMHDAHSTDDASLHITFGLLGKSYSDLMIDTFTRFFAGDVAFRRSLPPGYARVGFDRQALRADLVALLHRTAEATVMIDDAIDTMAESFTTARRPAMQGQLVARLTETPVQLDDRLVARPDLIWRLATCEAAKLTVLVGGCQIDLPAFTQPAIEHALCGQPFHVKDLPGDIDDAARLVLARRLLKESLLIPVEPGEA